MRSEDLLELRERVAALLDNLESEHPHTPLVVLSALAEGADQLVARVAVERGGRLVVPLPMPLDLYRADFETQEVREEFQALLSRAEPWFELPLVSENTVESVSVHGPSRDRQYELVDAYIARNSQILIALWDGQETGLVAGTSCVVQFKLEGCYGVWGADESPLDSPDSGPVFQIVTPRRKSTALGGDAFSTVELTPRGFRCDPETGTQIYRDIYSRMNEFNEDVVRLGPRLEEQLAVSRSELYPPSSSEPLVGSSRALQEAFATADSLALHFQKDTGRTLWWLFGLVFVAAAFFDLYAHVFQSPIMFGTYILIAFGAHMVWRMARRRDCQNKHQDYRTLAEGMRVLFFWRLSGVEDSVAANYLRKQKGELDWIRNAIRSWSLPWGWHHSPATESDPEPGEGIRHALEYWVRSQAAYFDRAVQRDDALLARVHSWSKRTFLFGVVCAAALGVLLLAANLDLGALGAAAVTRLGQGAKGHTAVDLLREWLVALIALAAVSSALLHNVAEKRALSEHIKQFERMHHLFARAANHLGRAIDSKNEQEARALIRDLGREALVENGDWILLHRERPLEVPEEGRRFSAILRDFD